MPDHVHIVAPEGGLPSVRGVLSAFTARFGVRFDVLPPAPANSPAIAGRMIRYGFFNPTRAGLAVSPCAWPWSTLRDLVGASEPIWTPVSRIAHALGVTDAHALRGLTTVADVSHRAPVPGSLHAASIANVHRGRESRPIDGESCVVLAPPDLAS